MQPISKLRSLVLFALVTCLCIGISSITPAVALATDIAGGSFAEKHLILAESPYYLKGDLTLNGVLTIAEGVELFGENHSIYLQGSNPNLPGADLECTGAYIEGLARLHAREGTQNNPQKLFYVDQSEFEACGVDGAPFIKTDCETRITNCLFSSGQSDAIIEIASDEDEDVVAILDNTFNPFDSADQDVHENVLQITRGIDCNIIGNTIQSYEIAIYVGDSFGNDCEILIAQNIIKIDTDGFQDKIGITNYSGQDFSQIDPGKVVIRNNVITQVPEGGYGIMFYDDASDNTTYPDIYNNAIFGCDGSGISIQLGKNENYPEAILKIRNNLVQGGGGNVWEPSCGYQFWVDEDADVADLKFVNNIACELDYGIGSTLPFEAGGITHMGLKGNAANINQGENPFTQSVIAGFDNKDWDIVESNPDYTNWDFHLLCDSHWNGNDYNDLINSGWSGDDEWLDPDGSACDIGVYGGPYASENIDADMAQTTDYCLISGGWMVVNIWKQDTYRWCFRLDPFDELILHPTDGDGYSTIQFPESMAPYVDGTCQLEHVILNGYDDDTWGGFQFDNSTDISTTTIADCIFKNADYGAYLNGVTATSARLTFDHCTFDSCGTGVYANNSRLLLDSCTITGSYSSTNYGAGVYLSNCAAGKVVIDGCTIENNGTGSTVSSSGIVCSSSSPEIIWTTVKDNSGGGIYCSASTPDLNTWNLTSDRPNTIESNGGTSQTGSDGAEIYLTSSSFPTIQYNNISDGAPSPTGKLIYKTYSMSSVIATSNWWNGYTPQDSWFNWNGGAPVLYNNYYTGARLSSAEEFDVAMELWGAGEYAEAASHFRNTVYDAGDVGVNSVHYLSGCVGMMEEPNYAELRGFLQTIAGEHADSTVAKVALRFATDCLTQQGLLEDALAEYDARRTNAACLEDSVLAVVDYLSVLELAGGGDLDAAGEDAPSLMSNLLSKLDDDDRSGGSKILPTELSLMGCYPNPFNGITTVNFALPTAGKVTLAVYDLTGREAARLVDRELAAGNHQAVWQADGAPTGVYLIRLETASEVKSIKATLVK